MGFETITTTDKSKRDALFEDLRKNGNELERQVVKFSGVEPVLGKMGEPTYHFVRYKASGKKGAINFGVNQRRQNFRTTWSVAYPNGIVN